MTPFQEAQEIAQSVGMDFQTVLAEHYATGFVWSSPDCFILAMESWKDFEGANPEPAWFITLAVGDVEQFMRLDPKPNKRWIGFCREHEGDVHWIDYQRLRSKLSR